MRGTLLVTGSRGFLAPPLIHELRRRYPKARLVLVDRKPGPGNLECDLTDAAQTSRLIRRLRPQAIYHLAGRTQEKNSSSFLTTHLQTTVNILDAVRALPDPTRTAVLITGSAGEYGEPAISGPLKEGSPARPLSAYGASKLCQTTAALAYRHLGLRVFVARIFNVLGPGMPPHLSLGAFATQIVRIESGAQKPVLRTGSLAAMRDYIDVRDLAQALAGIIERGRPGEIYNICSGRAVAMSALLDGLLALASRAIAVVPLSGSKASGGAGRVFGSARRLRARTGWRPRISLGKSLQDTLNWHRRLPHR